MAGSENEEDLHGKSVFNRYLDSRRSNKKIQKTNFLFFEFRFWSAPSRPIQPYRSCRDICRFSSPQIVFLENAEKSFKIK